LTEEVTEESAESAEETPEDAYAELQAKVKLLLNENLSATEIIQKLFQEDYNTDTKALAKILGMTAFDVGRQKAYVKRQSQKSASERLKKSEKIDTGEAGTGKPGSVYKTDADSTTILKEVLSTHPDVTDRQILEIMSWAKMTQGGLQPAHLYALLSSMKGLDKNAASMLAQKYSLAIQKAQQEGGAQPFTFGPIPIGPAQQQPQQQQQFYWPQQPWQQPVQQGPPPGYVSKDEVDERIEAVLRKVNEERKIDKIEDKVNKLAEDIPKMIRENMPGQPETAMETVEIPLDANGNACLPGNAVTYKKITRPLGSESDLDKLLKYKNLLGKEISTDDIRRVVKEEVGGDRKEDPAVTALKTEMDKTIRAHEDLKKELQTTKDQISADEKRRLDDTIKGMENKIEGLRTALSSSGVNSPEGVIAQGITTFGNRKPAEKALEVIERIITPGAVATPVPQEGAVQTGEGVLIQEARKKGLVTVIRERVKGA
jgi:hypothetical protein